MSANDKQVSGTHYKDRSIQPWDYIIANDLGYLEGNVIKYVSRHKYKNGKADLEKAMHYLEKLLETYDHDAAQREESNSPETEGAGEDNERGYICEELQRERQIYSGGST